MQCTVALAMKLCVLCVLKSELKQIERLNVFVLLSVSLKFVFFLLLFHSVAVCSLRIIWNHHLVLSTKYILVYGKWKEVKLYIKKLNTKWSSLWNDRWIDLIDRLINFKLSFKILEAQSQWLPKELIKKSNKYKNHNQIDAFRIRSKKQMNRNEFYYTFVMLPFPFV